jgi:hypothetical protein
MRDVSMLQIKDFFGFFLSWIFVCLCIFVGLAIVIAGSLFLFSAGSFIAKSVNLLIW